MEMSPEVLRDLCKKHELYRTPQLNDALYCSLQGFRKIANLEPYTGLVSLFLEGNAITSLDGLPFMPHLRCLYIQQNALSDLVGLELLPGLRMLNISHNSISNLSGLQHCTSLATLLCSRNALTGYESINALSYCKELSTVDLQDNKLDSDAVFGNLKELPQLSCLYLRGNPVTDTTKQYRRTIICTFPRLTYLDERPIFDGERRCAEAWQKGGMDAERAEHLNIRQVTRQANDLAFESIQRIRREGFQKRRQSLGLPEGDTDPFFHLHSGAVWEKEEEPPELQSAKEQLARMTGGDKADMATDGAVTEEEAKECMYGSEELDEQLKGLGLDMATPEIQEILQNTGTPENTTAHIKDIHTSELPDAESSSVGDKIGEPAEHAEDIRASRVEPSHKEAARAQEETTVQSSPREPAEHVEAIGASESEPVREQAAAESHRSCLGDFKQAQGIWDNMKGILGEPAAIRKPLEPLPASNDNVHVEAKPERAQRAQCRATGYRSSFSFIKQKD